MRARQRVKHLLYPAYEARMARFLPDEALPKHVGVMLDGNRRWAKAVGRDTAHGHRAGAANIEPLLGWCEEFGIEVVTLWLLSTDNLNRPEKELVPLLGIIEEAVASLVDQRRWRLHPVGALDLLPARTAQRLKEAEEATRDVDGMLVNVAVGYGGRQEIADAVKSLLVDASAHGTLDRRARPDPRRRAHRRAPLHEGPARPRPRHPHLGRAAARRLPALAEREERVLLLRGATGRTFAASTSSVPFARTPPASAASVPEAAGPSLRPGPRTFCTTCHTPVLRLGERPARAGVSPQNLRGTGRTFTSMASGEARLTGRPAT
jgi:undecaprenyl pyrophosphate synthase